MSTQFAPVWNNASVDFSCIKANVTDSNSGSNSTLLDLQVGGTSQLSVSKTGVISVPNGSNTAPSIKVGSQQSGLYAATNQLHFVVNGGSRGRIDSNNVFSTTNISLLSSGSYIQWANGPFLYANSANCLEQYNGNTPTSAQTFRIYNTYTDATNNFERGKIGWSGDVFQIGTEKGLTSGSARALELQTDGTTRLTISTTGVATIPNTLDLTIRTVTYGATMAIDAALGNKIAITLTGNGTISNPTNAVDGRVLVFRLRQDATGSRIPVWDTKYAFVGDLATVTLSTAANKIDRVAFEYDSTDDKWYCISFIKGS